MNVPSDHSWTWALCPQSPDWRVEWPAIQAALPSPSLLAGCIQDPVHHAEGDVLTHTLMVCETLTSMPRWRELASTERSITFLAALFHDIGKPACTRIGEAGITSSGHALKGARMVRSLLYRGESPAIGVPPTTIRETIASLVRFHGLPLSLLAKEDPRRAVITASMAARSDHLAVVAEADARGRICRDQAQLIERVGLFEEFCQENGCWSKPRQFQSDHARYIYFSDGRSGPDYVPFDDRVVSVILMSGLPGAGKDHHIRRTASNLDMVSLDELRRQLKIDPADDQGKVVAAAKAQAMDLLRAGQPFIWNATNITRLLRQQLVGMMTAYKARVKITYVEADYATLIRRNLGGRIPRSVIEHLVDRLDPPGLDEAHELELIV